MAIYTKIYRKFYQDSLKLMSVSAEIQKMENIEQAFAFMATDINKKTRIPSELISQEIMDASPDDMILLVKSLDKDAASVALEAFSKKIMSVKESKESDRNFETLPKTFEEGMSQTNANIAVISVPGPYASLQTMIALQLGLNVLVFSDNVPIEDEIRLKDIAAEKNLLVMGPDCGTSIISGVPICFANKIRQGDVGVIGASGTGIQELTSLLDNSGYGITHAIGTGGRDLSEAVQGRTTLAALKLLAEDNDTKVITIISKQPSRIAEEKLVSMLSKIDKPAVLSFMGRQSKKISDSLYIAGTLEEAAAKIIAFLTGNSVDKALTIWPRASLSTNQVEKINQLPASRKQVKGLFTGGTLANEAKMILSGCDYDIVDLGDDEYTRGSVHPMIDPSLRTEPLINAFSDSRIGVILCDVVIGYGSHPDPAGLLVAGVEKARRLTQQDLIVIASVTGTDSDFQNRSEQIRKLDAAGIWVFPSNQYAAEVTKEIANKIQNR